MIEIVCFLLLFVACTQGMECHVLDRTTLKCIFPNNVNSTQTDFTAYFYPNDNSYPELLIDCGWVDERLKCIGQKGVRGMRPVSNIAEIRLHARFAVKTGKYGCLPNGVSHEEAKLCQYTKSEPEEKHESLLEEIQKYRMDKDLPPTIIVPVFGAVLVIFLILTFRMRYNSHQKICSSKHPGQSGNSQNLEACRFYGKYRWAYYSTYCI